MFPGLMTPKYKFDINFTVSHKQSIMAMNSHSENMLGRNKKFTDDSKIELEVGDGISYYIATEFD